jgi:signal peptidase II
MIFYIIIILCILFDALTKYFASIFLQNSINLFWDFLYLQFVKNSWIAFSINLPFLKIITIILIIWIFYYYLSERKDKKLKIKDSRTSLKWHKTTCSSVPLNFKLSTFSLIDISFWLILWGAIWNWIERILFSEVSDFIWVKYFAVFNFADIFITIWIILYLIYLLKSKK